MKLEDLEQKQKYLNSLRPFSANELKLIRDEVIKFNTRSKPRFGELEGIRNAYNLMDYIMKEESTFPYPVGYKHPLTEDMLKNINRSILEYCYALHSSEKGFYRIGENDFLDDKRLPNRCEFIPKLKELIKWYSNNNDLLTKLATFHLQFLCDIHPFYDANGRTARTYLNLELARNGYPMIGLKYSDITSYEDAFNAYTSFNDQEPMKRLIYQNIDKELDKCIAIKENMLK